jgi:hypothetical protein
MLHLIKKSWHVERVDGVQDNVLLSDFDRHAMLQVRGSVIAPNRGLLGYREISDAVAV